MKPRHFWNTSIIVLVLSSVFSESFFGDCIAIKRNAETNSKKTCLKCNLICW